MAGKSKIRQKCCLCGEEFGGYGNNPAPLAEEGRCCDRCNEKVVSARFAAALEARPAEEGRTKKAFRDSRANRARAAEILKAGGLAFTSVTAVGFVKGKGVVVNYQMGVTPGCEYWIPLSMFEDGADLAKGWREIRAGQKAARKPSSRRLPGPSLQDWIRAFRSGPQGEKPALPRA